jgi:hypothetical protein
MEDWGSVLYKGKTWIWRLDGGNVWRVAGDYFE